MNNRGLCIPNSPAAETLTIGSGDQEAVKLRASDIIITQTQEFCQIVRCFANYSVLVRALGSDKPTVLKTHEILINLSHLGTREQNYIAMRREREKLKPGDKMSVYSKTSGCWCPAYVVSKFNLTNDIRLAHGDLWFQLGYYCTYSSSIRFKQLKFDSSMLGKKDKIQGSVFWPEVEKAIQQLDADVHPDKRVAEKRRAEASNAAATSGKATDRSLSSSSSELSTLTSMESSTRLKETETKTRRPERFPEFDEPKKYKDGNSLEIEVVDPVVVVDANCPPIQRSHSCDEIGGQDEVLHQEYRHYSFTTGCGKVVEEFANSEHDPESMLIHRQPSCDSLHEDSPEEVVMEISFIQEQQTSEFRRHIRRQSTDV